MKIPPTYHRQEVHVKMSYVTNQKSLFKPHFRRLVARYPVYMDNPLYIGLKRL